MAAEKPLVIGPFSGGLNTRSDMSAVEDDQAVEALNFDMDLDGSLKSRPPFQDIAAPIPMGTSGHAKLLGYFYSTGGWFLIASDGLSKTYYTTQALGTWNLITSTFSATAMVQFDNKAWLLAAPSETDPGGYWTPGGGFVADANMPKGTTIAAHKYRLWVSPGKGNTNGGRVYYSKVLGQPNFWQAPSFQEVGTGDGQDVVYLTTYYNNLIIFRTMSIFSWQFTNDPGAGEVAVVVPGVGIANADCAVAFENNIYFMYDDKAYGFINNRAYQINEQVPFNFVDADTAIDFSVGQFNKRILFTYYDTTYVYSLFTKTWTRWRSQAYGAVAQFMSPSAGDTDEVSFALSADTQPDGGSGRAAKVFRIEDRLTNASEPFQCVLQTKNFNYQLSGNFKRLFWWGVDAIFYDKIVGQAIPVAQARTITWGQMIASNITWGALLGGTWGAPYVSDTLIQTTTYDQGLGVGRKFAKFKKSLWFRQVYFRVTFNTTGAIGSAPVQLFSISAYVVAKQTTSKAIT